jgi:hypothetical protein
MDTFWKIVLIVVSVIVGGAIVFFALAGFGVFVGRPAWEKGQWFDQTAEVDNPMQDPGMDVVHAETPDGDEDSGIDNDTDDPILPDMPTSDIHTSWIGDISFIGYKGQWAYPPNDYIDGMVNSDHVYSLHQIDAYDEEMIFIVTWGEDIRDVDGQWYTNEYDVQNFNWDKNSPEQFFDRFVEEIRDWTVPNSIKEDSTFPSGTTIHVTIFFGTGAQSPYHSFNYTKP